MLWNGVDLNTHGWHIEDELSKFYGSVNLDVLLIGWTPLIMWLSVYYVSEENKVKLVSKCLKGRALTWWKPWFKKSVLCNSFSGFGYQIWPI